ncbi:MAG TPA: type VI secretion system-associated protein TagF [Gammaproteobacteria bacterium]|nr:type VI secretion system-associated protein TagF [Gammaproteobacteria bacterium]
MSGPGLFGKLPYRGDFIYRELPKSFTTPWDHWLQDGLATARQQLGEAWLEPYLIAPVWRFSLAKGTLDQRAWLGLLMPSVDKVGRHFPLTLAAPLPSGCLPPRALLEFDAWLGRAEALCLAALEEQLPWEHFLQQIRDLGMLPQHGVEEARAVATDRLQIELIDTAGAVQNAYPELLAYLLAGRETSYSLWWTEGSPQVKPALLFSRALPPAAAFCALLDGAWARWGWTPHPPHTPLLAPGENG